MKRTRGSYEWWYTDILSDDGEWTLVIIFLLGNPFSSYYRLAAFGSDIDPVAHNGMLIALHRGPMLHHYLFARYPREEAVGDPSTAPYLSLGPNQLQLLPDGSLRAVVNEENGNRRRIHAEVTVEAAIAGFERKTETNPNDTHWWLPAIPSGRASVNIAIQSSSGAGGVERISFKGSGYHDHNWGTLPFDKTLQSWTWARADFGNGNSAIAYWNETPDSGRTCLLLRFAPGSPAVVHASASIRVIKWGVTRFAVRFPERFIVTGGDTTIKFVAGYKLENVPFYIRFRTSAVLSRGDEELHGTGTGEYFRPAIMGTALAAAAMERRIYNPADGC